MAQTPKQNLGTILNTALQHHQAGRFKQAEPLYRQVLAALPNQPDALHLFGFMLHEIGRGEEGIELIQKAIAFSPDTAVFYNSAGLVCKALKRYQDAAQHLRKALELEPGLVEARCNLGNVYAELEEYEAAEHAFRQALAAAPNHATAHNGLGTVLKKQKKLEEAKTHFGKALELDKRFWEAAINLGNIEIDMGRPQAAVEAFRKTLAIKSGLPEAHMGLGNALLTLGNSEEATKNYRRVLQLNPDNAGAWFKLSGTTKYTAENQKDIEAMEGLLARPGLADEDAIHLHFALGKAYDDTKEYARAFPHYEAANRMYRQNIRFDQEHFTAFCQRIREVWTPAFVEARQEQGNPTEKPVFILGMPRSGTTLVEQVLASHPQVHGAGELTLMRDACLGLQQRLGIEEMYPESFARITAPQLREVADDILGKLEALAPEVTRITDKMPGNFLYVGAIASLFPRARIIHCRRDPLDVCLSIYFQFFNAGNEYAYDFEDIATYYRQYQLMMRHWAELLPGRIVEVDYATLVEDAEAQSRRLVESIGLPWDNACLDFHKNKREVYTASKWQVRQPIYRSSLERWRNYEHFIQPLRAALESRNVLS